MKNIFIALCFLLSFQSLEAQKFFTRSGKIDFVSDAQMEKIEAKNSKVTSVLDLESGKLEFAVLVKAFQFEKALMQEHFNENYMESSKFPKAIFKGEIKNFSGMNLEDQEMKEVQISGDLTIHGVTQRVNTSASLKVMPEEIIASSEIVIKVADYDIKIPKLVEDNIAKEVTITVDMHYQPLNR